MRLHLTPALNTQGSRAEDHTVTTLTVSRWTKYGKDRLYVNADGQRVGWLDLVSGQTTLERPDLAVDFKAALADYFVLDDAPARLTAQVGAEAIPVPPSEPVRAATALPEPVWTDLAGNRPGQAARAQAEVERAALRDRTKVGAFLARTFDVKTDERAWRIGADGEETVGAKLDKLTKHGWHVLHAVPVGNRGSDIDHVLIGHGGVYTVNTKTYLGKSVWVGRYAIKVDGHSVPYLRNSRHEAQRAQRLLSAAVGWTVPVHPVLVFLTGTLIPQITIKQQPDDVTVLDRMDIPGAFKWAPKRLNAEQVGEVYEQARRSSTWMTSR
jgi:hypothetical protein